MTDKVHKTRLEVEGDDATRAIEEHARAVEELGQVTDDAGDKAEGAGEKQNVFGKAVTDAATEVSKLAQSYLGTQGLMEIMRAYERQLQLVNERLKENAELSRAAAEASLDAAFLDSGFNPETLQTISAARAIAGVGPGEAGGAVAAVKSQLPTANDEQIRELILSSALKRQQTGTGRLDELASANALLFARTGNVTSASNILEESITQAGVSQPGQLAGLLGRFVDTGTQGGLTVGESAGLAAAVTGINPAQADTLVTGLTSLQRAIRTPTTEDAKALSARFAGSGNFIEQLQSLVAARQSGELTEELQAQLIPAEAATLFGSLASGNTLQDVLGRVQAVQAAAINPESIVAGKGRAIFGASSQFAQNQAIKQSEQRESLLRESGERSLDVATQRQFFSELLTERVEAGTLTEQDRQIKLERYDRLVSQGVSPQEAIDASEAGENIFTRVTGGNGLFGIIGDRLSSANRSAQSGPLGNPENDFSTIVQERAAAGPTITIQNQFNSGVDPLTDKSNRSEQLP